MTYKVTLGGTNAYTVKLVGDISDLKVLLQGGGGGVGDLANLQDVDASGQSDRWVLVYDAASNAYKFVDPDEVINAAANVTPTSGTSSVGLSTAAVNYLDQALDDKIDVDAGTF